MTDQTDISADALASNHEHFAVLRLLIPQLLQTYAATIAALPDDMASARRHLAEVHGALSLTQADELARVAQTLSMLAEHIDTLSGDARAEALTTLTNAIQGVQRFLAEWQQDSALPSLHLFPYWKPLLELLGAERQHPADLYRSNINWEKVAPAVARLTQARPLSTSPFDAQRERKRFEHGLLLFLRDASAHAGLLDMQRAVAAIQLQAPVGRSQGFWFATGALLKAIEAGGMKVDVLAKRLFARLNQQIRRVSEGSLVVSQRLLDDVLYFLAGATTDEPQVVEARLTLGLETWEAIDLDQPRYRHIDTAQRAAALNELETYRRDAEALLADATSPVPKPEPVLQALAHLELNACQPVLEMLHCVVTDERGRASEQRVAECLRAWQWLQHALQHADIYQPELLARGRVIVNRLRSSIEEELEPAPRWLARLATDEVEQGAQAVLCAELKTRLAQVETTLDAHFRASANTSPDRNALEALEPVFNDLRGTFTLLGENDAARVIEASAHKVRALAQSGQALTTAQAHALTQSLSALDHYVDLLAGRGTWTATAFRFDAQELQLTAPVAVPAKPSQATWISVEIESAQRAARLKTDMAGLPDTPITSAQRARLERAITQLRQDADLMDDQALRRQVAGWLDVLQRTPLRALPEAAAVDAPAERPASAEPSDAAEAAPAKSTAVMPTVSAAAPSAPAPSVVEVSAVMAIPEVANSDLPIPEPRTIDAPFRDAQPADAQPAETLEANADPFDSELLSIFVQEATELSAALITELEANAPNVRELRRIFHTLKGSSRMVGLNALGDFAWQVEQSLNDWLAVGRSVQPEETNLLRDARTHLDAWLQQWQRCENAEQLATWAHAYHADDLSARLERLNRMTDAVIEDELSHSNTGEPEQNDFEAQDEDHASDDAETQAESEVEFQDEAGFQTHVEAQSGFESIPVPEQPSEPATEPILEPQLALEAQVSLESKPEPEAQAELEPAFDFESESEAKAKSALEPAAEPESESLAESSNSASIDSSTLAVSAPEQSVQAEFEESPQLPLPALESPTRAATTSAVEAPYTSADVNNAELRVIGPLRLAPALFDIYIKEASELIELLAQDFMSWSQTPQRIATEIASRSAHSLAGSSGAVGLKPARDLALALEQVLRLANHEGLMQPADIALLLRAADELHHVLMRFRELEWPPAAPALCAELLTLAERLSTIPAPTVPAAAALPNIDFMAAAEEAVDELDEELLRIFQDEATDGFRLLDDALRRWRESPTQVEASHQLLRGLHTLKGSARMAGAMRLGQILHALESHTEAAMNNAHAPQALLDNIATGLDLALQHFDALSQPSLPAMTVAPLVSDSASSKASEEPVPGTAGNTGAAVRVRAELIDRLVSDAGEVSVSRSRMEIEVATLRQAIGDFTENLNRLRGQLREVDIQAESQLASRREQLDRDATVFDPLEFDRYTRMQELTRIMAESVGDLGTVQHSLSRGLERVSRDLATQSRLTRELQHDLMRVRMLPFGSVADRLFRITRQMAKETDKRVSLDIQGVTVDIDRSVLERLIGPLEHMLRNAVVHGIEPRAQRIAAGKPEQGEITLSVRHEGNDVVIVLSDDGGGLCEERIRAKAIAQGLIASDDNLTPEALANLIFQPGFSTATQLTALAGRGIGMDAVRAEIIALGGRVSVLSESGRGCRFVLTLPLTLATAHVVLVRGGTHTHAVQASSIERIVQLKPAQLAESHQAAELMIDDMPVPLHYLPYLLGDTHEAPAVQRHTPVLVIRSMGERLAVHVDAIVGNQEVVVKHTGPLVSRISGIQGACVMGSGEIVLILDPVHWRRQTLARGLMIASPALASSANTRTLNGTEAARLAATPTVMVVDDSLTVRRITQRLLEREGLRVILAKDGLDALEQMQELVPQVLLVDIEMPRMDGFDLTRHVRADARTRHVPIIMITSRIADKHRQYAASIGVDLYLGKPYQEAELLNAVRRFLSEAASPQAKATGADTTVLS